MVAAWCFLLDIGPQSLGPRREVDIALRSLCQALENLELNFCNTLQVFWCILFLHFFWIHWRSQKKMNLKSNVMNSLKSRSTFQTSVSKGWRMLAGWLRTGLLNATVKGIETPQEMQRWAAFFFVSKNSQRSQLQRLSFSRFATFFGDVTPHIKTPQKITKTKNEKPKRHPFPSCPTYSHTKTFPTFPYSITVRLSPKPVVGVATFLPFPTPSTLPLFLGKRRQRHGSASGTVQLWSRTWRRLNNNNLYFFLLFS